MSIPRHARDLPDDRVFVDPEPPKRPKDDDDDELKTLRLRSRRGRHHDLDDLQLIEYALRDPLLYEIADAIALPPHRPGRKHRQPVWMNLLYPVLMAHYLTHDATQRHLASSVRWQMMRGYVAHAWPDRPERHLPETPMTADAYFRFRDTYLTDPYIYAEVHEAFRYTSADLARAMGFFDSSVGSPTHPAPTNVLFGDGKNVSAMYRSVSGAKNVNPVTGEIKPRRHDPDARRYKTNGGTMARGIPWVDLDCRQPGARNERLILDFDAVALDSDEMTVGMALVERTLTLLPATQVLVWDGAMKGVHMRRLIADLGIIPVNHATEKPKGNWPKLGTLTFRRLDGQDEDRDVWLIRGIPTIQVTIQADTRHVRLVRTKTIIRERTKGYWVTNEYVLPDHPAVPPALRGATTSIRHDTTEQADKQRKWGLNENLRIIDYMDDEFPIVYGVRNSAENQNRILEDTLWAGRAHSVGIPSGRIDHLGFALYINLIARIAYEKRTGVAPVPWLDRPARLTIAA